MCEHCLNGTDPARHHFNRRDLLASATAAAGLAMMPSTTTAQNAPPSFAVGTRIPARGFGLRATGALLERVEYMHRAMRPDDVVIDIMYAGICHSDIHTGRGDWGPINGPLIVPGHEIVGRIAAVGPQVSRFKVGDIAGVGTMVDSCAVCENCTSGLEQYCTNGATWTYGPDRRTGDQLYGGYADRIVLKEHFAYTIPEGLDLRSAAPLLCAGITTFSPLNHWDVQAGMKVGVVGLGGLGHMALKLMVDRGAEVTVFTTTPEKEQSALEMGAKAVVVWPDETAFGSLSASFDFILSTVPTSFPIDQFTPLLTLDGHFVNVGQLGSIEGISGWPLVMARRSVAGSNVGGVPETSALLEYCARNKIAPEVEVISVDQINQACDRVIAKDVRYRFVIDMNTL